MNEGAQSVTANAAKGDPSAQEAVFAFLADPATHGAKAPVARIDTHGAAVFLAGDVVYKVKRAVRFPFLDYSTLDLRRRACEKEIAVNRANAPDIYLGVVPISRENERISFGYNGEIIEWAVRLKRFDESRTLDHLAAGAAFDEGLAIHLAEEVAAAHARAEVFFGRDAVSCLAAQVDETAASLLGAPSVFAAGAAAAYRENLQLALAAARPALQKREAAGRVRRCHGDLHLGNIVLIGDRPTLFDAIEFNDDFAICDILYDLAFLLMDLYARGLRLEANLLMNRYLSVSPDIEDELCGLAALPLFLSLRAAIRAKVTVLRPDQTPETQAAARALFDAAVAFLRPAAPRLVAVGGLSGAGKTALSRKIAPFIGRAPGAVHLRSDVERKRLFNTPELSPLEAQAYRPEANAATYERLDRLAGIVLATGQSVILDATHRNAEERAGAAAAAARAGADFSGIWLEAPAPMRIARVSTRRDDASDAGPAVAAAQTEEARAAPGWTRLDARRPLEDLAQDALAALEREEPMR